jgi:hypothetical protein
MKLYGWCTRCRKVKPVRVGGWNGKTPVGICDGCERERRSR